MGGPDATPNLWKQLFSAVRASGGYPGNVRDFTRFGGKTSYRLVNRGPVHMPISGHAAYVRITVGNDGNDVSSYKLCHVIRGEGAKATNHVTCDDPVVGRFVRFQRFRGGWMIYELTICEVQVYGYLYRGMKMVESFFDS